MQVNTPALDRTLYLPILTHMAMILRDLQMYVFTNLVQDSDENRCNFWSPHPTPDSNPRFQAMVHTSNSGPGGAKFSSGCHSVFPVTPEPGHGTDAASIAGSHQECACEPGVGNGSGGRRLRDGGHFEGH